MGLFQRKNKPAASRTGGEVQLRPAARHPFHMLNGYIPLSSPEFQLYRAIREAVPVVDAAITKLIRLAGGVSVACGDKGAERALNRFLKTVPAGWNQLGIQSFLDAYLDSLLTCGRAVGEMVLDRQGREIRAVLCGNVEEVEVLEEGAPLVITLCRKGEDGQAKALPRQDLLLFTPYQPTCAAPYGVSLLHAMPFLTEILLNIYHALGNNWERAGNLRYAVVYKPGGEGLDKARAQERSAQLASEWSAAMQSTKSGSIRDFVAVGDVEIRVIGAECPIPDCQAPVRLIVEQLISQTGIPPFLLGLNWSSTERMSAQQADMMTSEITALRRTVTPPMEKICRLWLAMHGYDCPFEVVWEDINLQDLVEEAKAELYRQQARKVERELIEKEEKA